jgi:hypothetical protein
VPRQGDVDQLFTDFRHALATNPPDIPMANVERGLAQTAQQYAPISPVRTIEQVNEAAQRLQNILKQSASPTATGAAPSPMAAKASIDALYKQLKEMRALARSMPAGSAERAHKRRHGPSHPNPATARARRKRVPLLVGTLNTRNPPGAIVRAHAAAVSCRRGMCSSVSLNTTTSKTSLDERQSGKYPSRTESPRDCAARAMPASGSMPTPLIPRDAAVSRNQP